MPEHGLICSISKNRLPDAHERLEGPPRQFRRHWSDDFKARAVAQAMEPGASVSAIVHRIGIHPSQLFVFGWRRDARDGQRSSSQDRAGLA
ncbi:transposase [Rhizobium leguminosarum]|uniref:transposase n=1 Tax=Rhizobium leguminosarum TaxID=384 RepID=UPI00247A5905|nr:transposase [Rhizobium leguminosarum]